jgi:hypothetical protein
MSSNKCPQAAGTRWGLSGARQPFRSPVVDRSFRASSVDPNLGNVYATRYNQIWAFNATTQAQLWIWTSPNHNITIGACGCSPATGNGTLYYYSPTIRPYWHSIRPARPVRSSGLIRCPWLHHRFLAMALLCVGATDGNFCAINATTGAAIPHYRRIRDDSDQPFRSAIQRGWRAPQTAPQALSLRQGSHPIAVATTQAGAAGTQYVYKAWSDGGPASHITVGASAATYTASFQTQYQLDQFGPSDGRWHLESRQRHLLQCGRGGARHRHGQDGL